MDRQRLSRWLTTQAKTFKTLLFCIALLNSPAIVILIPSLTFLLFFPFLFWINIPALWFGLAKQFGQQHYLLSAFGAEPQTPLAWLLITGFWTVIAIGITAVDAALNAIGWTSRCKIPRRFSLETMFLVTTLIALALGIVMAAIRY
jgi:hypothetical protein